MLKVVFLHIRRIIPVLVLVHTLIGSDLFAQDLDPRAYVRVPINGHTFISGFSYLYGGIVTDPTLPVKNVEADLIAPSIGYARSFALFGLTSQALVVMPFGYAEVSGEVGGQERFVTRTGLQDMRLRWSLLFKGAPAAGLKEVMAAPRTTILGFSLNAVVPIGQFYSDKLINLGTNRWAIRPELAITQPIGKRWQLDFYPGIWLFTNNTSFFPGDAVRRQDPLGTFQGHVSYTIKPMMWVAFDVTYYVGGTSSVDDVLNDDRQSNMRIGITGVAPVSKRSSVRLAFSTGAVVRVGQDFTSISLGYQYSWMKQ
jgi:hypothetical protein